MKTEAKVRLTSALYENPETLQLLNSASSALASIGAKVPKAQALLESKSIAEVAMARNELAVIQALANSALSFLRQVH